MRRKTKFILGAAALIAVCIVLGLAFNGGKDPEDAYSWDTVNRGDVRETINASGEIQARVKINVGTTVAGEIKTLHVQDGQDVKAGDLLVTLDRERLQQALNQAEGALAASRQDASRLEAVLKRQMETTQRMERLFKDGLVSDEDCRQSRLALESAQLSYKAAQANIVQGIANAAAMRDGLSKAVILAPIAGRVTSLKAEKGEMAIPGVSNLPGATLMIISDMSEINAEINVNESEVVRLKLGQEAQVLVEPFPGKVFPGRVLEIASAAEKVGQDANMYKVKVAMDMKTPEIQRLRPGMSARAVILTSEAKGVLRVPLQSVQEREGSLEEAQKKGLLSPEAHSIVWVLQGGKALERSVKTGAANTQYFEVREGLQEGERVLTGPIKKLKELKERTSVKLKKRSDTQMEQEARKRNP